MCNDNKVKVKHIIPQIFIVYLCDFVCLQFDNDKRRINVICLKNFGAVLFSRDVQYKPIKYLDQIYVAPIKL